METEGLEILIFQCINSLSVEKQAYQHSTHSESKCGSVIAAPITCVLLLWQPGGGSEVYF